MGPPRRPFARWSYLVVFLLLFLVMAAAPALGRMLAPARRVDPNGIQLLVTSIGVVGATLGVLVFVVIDMKRNARWIDWALSSAGLRAEGYLIRGRQAHGVIEGREVKAYSVPASRYRPPTFELSAGCGARTRLAVGPPAAGAIAGMFARPQIQLGDPAFAHLRVTTDDEAWARALLADQRARAAVLRLAAPAANELRWIRLEPGAIHLRTTGLRAADLCPEIVRPAIDALVAVAAGADHAPAPQHPSEATALERLARDRSRLTVVVIAAVAVLLVACVAAAAALFFQRGR